MNVLAPDGAVATNSQIVGWCDVSAEYDQWQLAGHVHLVRQLYISLFANTGAVAINKANTICVIVLVMRKVADLRNVNLL